MRKTLHNFMVLNLTWPCHSEYQVREGRGKSSMKEEKNSKLGALVAIFNSHFA